MHRLCLALGSNLGDRRALISQALALIAQRVGRVERVSAIRETKPWGYDSPHNYLNAACLVATALTPRQCLLLTQQIERELGREQKTQAGAYCDRTIDIDLLLYDDLTLQEPGLILPHPRMKERPFVMEPLREILADSWPFPSAGRQAGA